MKNSKIKKVIGTAISVLMAAVLVALFVAVASVLMKIAKGKEPSLLGYRFYYVLTDSMTPTYVKGDIVLGKIVDESDVDLFTEGTVITYIGEYGEMAGNSVTHRIIQGVHYNAEINDLAVLTRGDKAGAAVDKPVRVKNIKAIILRKMTVASWIYGVFQSGSGFALVFIVPLAITLVVLIIRLVFTLRSERKAEEPEPAPAPDPDAQAKRIEELKKQAIEEYLKEQKKDE